MEPNRKNNCKFVSSVYKAQASTGLGLFVICRSNLTLTNLKAMKRRYLQLILLLLSVSLFPAIQLRAQNSTIQPDSVCIGGTEAYRVDSVPGSKYVWGIIGGQGAILTPPADSAANIQVVWDNTLGVDTLWVVEYNEYGCNGDTNKLAVVRFSLPEVTLSHSILDVCEGTTLNLNAIVSGLSPYQYQWYQDGIELTGETFSTLSIPNADASHTGNYTCEVTNACGVTLSLPCAVTILFNPVITLEPLNLSTCPGENVFLAVNNTGSEPITYQWFHEGLPLADNPPHITGTGNDTLFINGMLYADTGFYYCTVTNTCLSVQSITVNININIPPAIALQPDSVSICDGQNTQFLINVTGDSLFYQWRKNGVDIPGETSPLLSFIPALYSDTGNYECVILNTCGTVTTQNAHLNMNIPPVIVNQPDSVSICDGQNTQFLVVVTGDSLFYQWRKNGIDIPGANTPLLAFNPANYADTADYECIIWNTCGTVTTQNANLNMNIPPSIVNQPDSVSICDGQNTLFLVEVTGDSLFYQWRKNGVDIPGATNPLLSFTPAFYSDTANYVCVITNTCGTVTTQNAHLNMNIPPVIVNQPDSVSICNGQNTQFLVQVTGDSLYYQWRKNGVNIPGAMTPLLAFTPATYADTADYECIIWNTCGTVTTQNANLNMNIAPMIVNQPDSVSICNGQNTQFLVEVTGDSLFYQWRKNGVNIPGATNPLLTFTPASYSDTANYVCVITNTCGTVTTQNAHLNMNIPPVIVNQPDSVSICNEQNTQFLVQVTGDSLFYQWRKNGVNIPGATTPLLTFTPATYADTADYECIIWNTCGTVTTQNANLNMNIPPAIAIQPQDISACLTNSVTFTVVATGDSLFYQWQKNGLNIPGANAASLTLPSIQYSDTADYVCYIWNTCGDIYSQPANLNINILPVIVVHPKKTSSCVGDSESLFVIATGDSLYYQWRRNGIDIPGATFSSITINPVTTLNTGDYTCFVYNNCGSQLSNIATLTVNLVPQITQQPVKVSSCPGYSANFTVVATGDSLFYQWRKNGVNMPGQNLPTLVINPVNYTDTATYTCYIFNTCGDILSNPAKLTINIPPVITLHPQKTSTCVGASITLIAAATGDSLFYQWRFNGVDIPGQTNPWLTINPVQYSDTGFYTCRIFNTCGTQTTIAAHVTVNIVPVITQHPVNISTCPGGNVTFTTLATGDSLFYQWRKNGFDMSGANQNTLTFNPVTYGDTADYTCYVYNTCGFQLSGIGTLNINIPPVITQDPISLLTCVGDINTFTVGVTGDSLFYQWRFEGVNIPGATGPTHTINPVQLSHIGVYDVIINNTCGTAVSDTAHLYANIDPTVIVDPVSKSSCIGYNHTFEVGILALGSALPNFQWYKDGNLLPGQTNNTISINNISLSSTGAYQCQLWNNCDAIFTDIAYLTVNIAPQITQQPQNISTCIGNAESFVVGVTGDSLFFQWYKDGLPVPGATTNTLMFNPVQASHMGTYYLRIWNTCGLVNSQPVVLYMNIPPSITMQPANQKACTGDNVILMVMGIGDFIEYQWFKDGIALPGATSNVLQYNPVDYTARGQYQCRVQNNCGTVWSDLVWIWVNTTPIITQQPQGISTCEGENYTLSVIALGDSIQYQWKLEGIDIPGATSNTYTISNIQFSQTGNYTCYMSTRCGNAMTQQAKVSVNRVPVITAQPTNINACVGDYVALDFGITGDSLYYQWYKDGVPVAGATQQTLQFPAITVADRGIYRCYIYNTCGNVWTISVNVWANILPGVITQPVAQTRCENDSVSFRITPVGDNISLQWYHNGNPIPGATGNIYEIPVVALADAGLYFCRVTSTTCGFFDSDIITFTVVQKFQIQAVTTNISCNGANNGAIDLTLTNATAPVRYRWSTGATTQDLTGLAPGLYSVYIVDQNNCREKKTIEIGEPDPLAFVHDTTMFSNALRQGGPGNDMITAVKTDQSGNTYITGKFQGTANFQTQTLTSYGNDDIFLAKYNGAGNLSWIRQAGGSLNDQGRGLTLDSLGNIYLTGTIQEMAFFGTTQVNANGNTDIFLAKYDNNGNFIWVKNFGGFFDDAGNDIVSTDGGYTWLAGSFQGIATFGGTTLISNGGDDAFLAKFNADGDMQWVRKAGGTSEDFAHSVTIDIAEDAIITGRFQGTAQFGTTNLVTSGNNDIFLAKYDPIGNLKWVRKAGGSGNDLGRAVKTDQSQNIYLAGSFEGNASFGTLNTASAGLRDAFVAKYDKNGNAQWVRRMGGTAVDNAKALAVDALGNSYTAGTFRNSMVLGDKTLTSAGANDLYVAKHNTNGYLVWSQQAGGTGADSAMAIALRNDKNLALAGSFNNMVAFGATALTSQGGDDAFLVRLNQVAVPTDPVITNALCFGGNEGSINLTVGGGTLPYTYYWSTGAITEDLVNLTAGTYWVFIDDANGCELDDSFQITEQFAFPTPPTSASVNRDYFCTTDPGNIILTATGGSGDDLNWYTGSCGGTLIGSGSPFSLASPESTTTYYVRWENPCGASICAEVTVHVIDEPLAPTSLSADQNPICEGTEYITLTAEGGQGEILKWYSNTCGGTEIGTGTPLTIPAPAAPTAYFARWESVCGPSPCATITVTVNPLPQPVETITASEPVICFNHTNIITLTATGGSGDELKWTEGSCGGTIIGLGPSILINPPTVTTTYYAYWENSCGTSECTSVTITVIPNPVAPTGITVSNNFFCANTLPNITLSVNGGSGETARWFTGYCGSTDILGTGTSITIPAPTVTTVYYVRWENSCGVSPCAFTTVTVYPQPVVFFSGLDPNYCINSNNVLLQGNMAPQGVFTGTGVINNGDGTAWFSPSIAGVGGPYTIAYSYTSPQGCNQIQTQTTTVHALPFVNFVGLANSYCINSPAVQLTGNQAPNGTFTGPGITASVNGIGTFDPAIAGIGTHQITYTYADIWGCTNSVTKTTTVYNIPVVNFAGLGTQYCVNANPVTLTGNHAPDGFFSGMGVTNIGLGQAIFDPAAAGVGGPYNVTYTYSDPNGCANSHTKTVIVNELPEAFFTGLDTEYCLNSGQDTLIGNMVPFGTFSGPGITNNGNGTAFFNPATAGAGGPYSITYTYTDPNGCSASQVQTTIVRALPQVSFTGLNPMYCANANPATLTGNKAPFGTFTGNGVTDNSNGTASFNPATAGPGTHQVTYTYTDNNGCSNSQTKTVIVNPLPVVSFTGLDDIYCINSPFDVLTGSQVPFGTFAGPGIENLNNGKARFHPSQAGIGGPYVITYTYIDNNACTGTYSDTTEVIDLPVLSVSGLEPSYCIDAAPDTITGNFAPLGSFSGPGITDLNIGKAIFNPAAAGVGGPYTIIYSYTDGSGCSNTISYEVMVHALPDVSFNTLEASYCVNGNPVILVGSHVPFGAFTGPGVTDYGNGTGLFEPAVAGVGGPYTIIYEYTDLNGCYNSQLQITNVGPTPEPPTDITASDNNFCTGTIPNITLTVVGGSGNIVRWFSLSCGGTEIGTGNSIVIPSPADTTLYFARWENDCGVSDCDTIQINIIHYPIAPDVVLSDENNFCATAIDSITLTAYGGFGQVFNWYSASCGGTIVGSGNPLTIEAPLATTTYFGRWETGCGPSDCKEVTVTVFPLPVIMDSLTVNHNDYCQGTITDITLTSWGGSGDFIEWYADECGSVPIGSGTPLLIPAPDTTTTYFARWINGCDSTECQQITVNVFPVAIPPDSINADNNNFCSGTVGIVTLTAFGGSGTTIEWFENECGGDPIGTLNPLLINAPLETTTYYARYVNDCGPSECVSFELTVVPQPVVPDSLTVDTNYFCQAYNGIIILNGFGGIGDTLRWYADGCNGTYVGKGTELRIPAPDTTTWYFAKWINICGESTCDSIQVVVDEPRPLDSVWTDTPIVCFDDPGKTNLFTSGGYGENVVWYRNNCGGTSIGSGTTLQINSPTMTTTYYARLENHCGVTECDSVEVLVIPQATPPVLITVDTNYFCPNTVTNITLTAFGGYGDTLSGLGDTLRWFANSCGGLEIGKGATLTIPAPVVTTRYYARWENSCSVSECLEFTVVVDVPRPVTSATVDTNNFCQGAVEDITLMSTGGYGEFLRWYQWDGSAYILLATGQPLNLFAPAETTTYYVRWENHCGVSAWDSVVVKVNTPFAPLAITVDTNGFCSDYGLPIQLTGIGGNGDTLRWFEGSCNGLELGTGNPFTLPAPTETTTYSARYENICGISDCISFTVNVVPAPVIFAGGLDSVCELGAFQIHKATAENITSVWWTTSGTGSFDDPNSLSPLYTLANDDIVDQDTVYLVMSAQGLAPCGIYTDTLTLLINPLPVITFYPADTAICRDSTLVIFASGAASYEWSPMTGLQKMNEQIYLASPDRSTTYTIVGTSASGCVDSTKYTVNVLPTPYVNLGEDLYLFTCEPIVLDAGGGSGNERYEWQDGSRRRTFKAEQNGTYWVKVSNDGCYKIDTIQVQLCEGYVWAPTAFTPNADGLNETFRIVTTDETIKFQMYIYSRSGMLVFQTDDITQGWDGRDLKGQMCPSGVYVWKIVYQGKGDKSPGIEKTQSGVITLIR